MQKMAYQRASEILISLREYILKFPPRNSDEEEDCNKKIKELYNELDTICRKINTELFRYKHTGMGDALPFNCKLVIRTVAEARNVLTDYDIYFERLKYEHEGSVEYTAEDVTRDMENTLLSKARKWLDANKESLLSLLLTTEEEEDSSQHDIQLQDNPTRKQIAEYFNELTVKDYASRTIEAYINEAETKDDDIKPIDRKKQPYRYPTDIVRDKIIPFLHERAAKGRK